MNLKKHICIFVLFINKCLLKIINIITRYKYNQITGFLYLIKHKILLTYLKSKYSYVIGKYKDNSSTTNKIDTNNLPIWICWLQGEENAPLLVKKCIANIRKHSNGHPVNLITLGNYSKYITIPEHIIKKHKQGNITNTHFSDILRVNLIANHGGIWLDTTIFCNKDIPNYLFELPVFSCEHKETKKGEYVPGGKWTTYALGGNKNSLLYEILINLLYEYWRKENKLIVFHLFDYFIALSYYNVPSIKKQIDNIPNINSNVAKLSSYMNKPFDKQIYDELSKDTFLFKLSWKSEYKEYTENKEKTFYYYLINDLL